MFLFNLEYIYDKRKLVTLLTKVWEKMSNFLLTKIINTELFPIVECFKSDKSCKTLNVYLTGM